MPRDTGFTPSNLAVKRAAALDLAIAQLCAVNVELLIDPVYHLFVAVEAMVEILLGGCFAFFGAVLAVPDLSAQYLLFIVILADFFWNDLIIKGIEASDSAVSDLEIEISRYFKMPRTVISVFHFSAAFQ